MHKDQPDPSINNLDEGDIKALKSIRLRNIILPILIGAGVVAYLLRNQFDFAEFQKISWSAWVWIWIGVAFIFLIIRHLAYSTRLWILSSGAFSWRKCIELIFIWEFSAAVSPTSVGGSAVAVFALGQEKIGGAKSATIVLYTVVVDTFFFLSSLPILLAIFGPNMIRPGLSFSGEIDGWFYSFVIAYCFMFCYGMFFFYGLFINPRRLKHISMFFTKLPFLKRFNAKLDIIGEGFIKGSHEIKKRNWKFHLSVMACTTIAWSMRFLLINCLIIGIVQTTDGSFMSQATLFSRLESMFVIMAFSPTPGGAGFAEFVFGGFLSDYVPLGISIIVASVWRLMTYYSYLLAGVIIIPNWIRNILNQKRA